MITHYKEMVFVGLEMCKTCQKQLENNKGLTILGVHICKECVQNISEVKIDSLKYENYKLAIKEIWIDYLALNY